MPKRMTKQTLRLLEVLLTDPTHEWFGVQLMEAADMKSGTAYPILHRLEADGWLSSAAEDIDPKIEGRPRRRFYKLSGIGQREAESVVEGRRKQAESRPSLRPLPGGAVA
jgi:DNA-binding PadR family transcriptional regulator